MTTSADIEIRGRLGDATGTLPLIAMAIDSSITGLVCTTVVRQTFRNTRSTPIEATYIFPLPDRAGVTACVAELGGRTVVAELRERQAAREEYAAAIAEGRRAALAEEDRPGVFTTTVGNIDAGESAAITITLTGPVSVECGEAEYRFPLVVAPRFIPGDELDVVAAGRGFAADTDAVPDASRITPPTLLPGQESPVALTLTARFDAGSEPAATALVSSLHSVALREGDGLTVSLLPGERLDRDVILRWPVADSDVITGVVLSPDAESPDCGTWMLTLVAPKPKAARPRDVVIVLDQSGSMAGWKMVAARRAAARLIDSLTQRDRFAMLAFNNTVSSPSDSATAPVMTRRGESAAMPAPVHALNAATDQNRWAAVEWLAHLEAAGGTEMLRPLGAAAELLGAPSEEQRERFLILVTDGQVGNEDQILNAVAPLTDSTRIFALGIDRAVNAGFLRRLAALGGGRCELIESAERLDTVMATLHRRIASPVVRDLAITASGIELEPDTMTPGGMPDLFPGSLTIITGRWRSSANAAPAGAIFTATGKGFRAEVAAQPNLSAAVRTVWARAFVRDLEDRYAVARSGRDELSQQIVAVSLQHGVLSRFTAFIAVDREGKPVEGSADSVVQPVEHPSRWATGAVAFGGPPQMMARGGAPMAAAGGAAPIGHLDQRRLRKSDAGSIDGFGQAPVPAGFAPLGEAGRAAEDAEPIDITPYLDRIEDVLRRAANSGQNHDELAETIQELVGDLESTGVTGDLVSTLTELAVAVRHARATDSTVAAVRAAVVSRSPAAASRSRFWA